MVSVTQIVLSFYSYLVLYHVEHPSLSLLQQEGQKKGVMAHMSLFFIQRR
jgi:hypothetical protein